MDINSDEWDKLLCELYKELPQNMDDSLIVDLIHFIFVQYDIDWVRALRLTHIINDLHATHTGEKVLSGKNLH
jgi:hypothetical protein